MANEKFTQLPTVSSATVADIIAAVQAGVSVQMTLQQVLNLTTSALVSNYAGNPNGFVAGSTFNLCWDTANHILYVCTTTGNSASAVWMKSIAFIAGSGITIDQAGNTVTISTSGSGLSWVEVTSTTQAMVSNTGYFANNGSLVTLSLPATSSLGDVINIVGKGAGGWLVSQGSGQVIYIGSSATTGGVGGSIASTNQFDSLQLVCSVANTAWTILGGAQGNITVV
jgi:hypothetical protein